jgi:hypothetical protein
MSQPVINTPLEQKTPENAQPIQKSEPQQEFRKVKINGKEVNVPIQDLINDYGKGRVADEKFQKAAEMVKQAEQLKSMFSEKKVDALLKAGWSEDEIEEKMAEFLVKRAQEKSMTPQQRAFLEQQKEYERLKKAEDDRKNAERQKSENELRQREAQLYQTAFLSDVAKADNNTWLDLNDPVILSTIINDITIAATKHDYDMPVSEAVKRLEEKMQKRGPTKKKFLQKLLKDMIPDTDDTDLEAFLEKGVKGIRERSVEALRKNESPFSKQQPKMQGAQTAEEIKRDLKYHRDLRMGRVKLK